jgi:hypothetical protein
VPLLDGVEARSSVAPWTTPLFTPPPASQPQKPKGW